MAKLDFTTTLSTLLDRAVEDITEKIAQDGLVELKHVLDDAGFSKTEELKNYDVFAHVYGTTVLFEIQVDFEALDDATKERAAERGSNVERIRKAAKTFAYSGIGGAPKRIIGRRDARRPADDARNKVHDARRPARRIGDSRKTSEERAAEHAFALHAPRGISITKEGKLSVILEKTVKKSNDGIRMPSNDFEGVIGSFMERLLDVISSNFLPRLEAIISRGF